MKVLNLINAKGKTVRLLEDETELTVDADGRYFTLPLATSVSVAENMILTVSETDGLSAYSYAGQLLFTLQGLVGREVPRIISGTVMNPPEVLTYLSRVKDAPLIRETPHYFCACEGGSVFLIDLSDGKIVY